MPFDTILQVLLANGVDIEVGDTLDLSAIYMPENSVFVAKMSVPKDD